MRDAGGYQAEPGMCDEERSMAGAGPAASDNRGQLLSARSLPCHADSL